MKWLWHHLADAIKNRSLIVWLKLLKMS